MKSFFLDLEEMSVDINLLPYNLTYTLPRDFILSTLVGSLLAEALDGDPEAMVIPMINPIVTPAVMQFLVDYSQGQEPIQHIPDLIEASRYLNIPWMLYYTDPLYDAITDRATLSSFLSVRNLDLLNRAIRENRLWVVGYFLAKGVEPTFQMLEAAIKARSVDVFKILLSKYTPKTRANLDYYEEYHSNSIGSLIRIAAQEGQINMLALLLPKGEPNAPNRALDFAALANQIETVQWLLQRPDVDPTWDDYIILYLAAQADLWDVVNVLLADPRVQEKGPAIVENARNE